MSLGLLPVHSSIRRQSRALARRARWPGVNLRAGTTAVVAGCAGLGAVVGVVTDPTPPVRYRAQVDVRVDAASPARQAVAWRTLRAAAQTAQVREAVNTAVVAGGASVSIRVTGDSESGLLSLQTEASSQPRASAAANAAAAAAVAYGEMVGGGPGAPRQFSFEGSLDGWGLGKGLFVFPPMQLALTTAVAHTGRRSLSANCLAAGCGPFVRLEQPYRGQVAYRAMGWIRATPSTRLRLVLGSTADDVNVSRTVSVGPRWRRLEVRWTPRQDARLAITAFQLRSSGATHLNVDDVSVGPVGPTKAATPSPGVGDRYSVLAPAVSAGVLKGKAGPWALGGAATGFLVGLAAAGAGAAAGRRRPATP